MLPPQRISEPDQAITDSGLDSAKGQLQQLRYLALGIAAEVGQRQRLSLNRGQRRHSPSYPLHVYSLLYAIPHLVDLSVSAVEGISLVACYFAGHRPHPIDRPPMRHGSNPGDDTAFGR